MNPRALCVQVLRDVIERRRYLDTALAPQLAQAGDAGALVQELSYGCLRWYHQLDAIAARLLERPLKQKDSDLHLLLLVGLYQLRHLRIGAHAAVDETVEATKTLGKPWAKGLINACLRNYQRSPALADEALRADDVARFSYPRWMIEQLQHDHPEHWQQILEAGNERPPMTLRVNARRQTRAGYVEKLRARDITAHAPDDVDSALVLATPAPVTALPGFDAGDASVQDAAAQLAAVFLDAQAGHRVLDACAAPGGKTAHLLERTPDIELLALDTDALRTPLIETNLKRLGLHAEVRIADAADTASWWDGRAFDRILLDVPCSATGVIRRHPDIKLRRQPEDLVKLEQTQTGLLEALWPLLAPGGKLLYATCSVFARENEDRIATFLAAHADAGEVPLSCAAAQPRRHGLQILPGTQTMDGFFYACLVKR